MLRALIKGGNQIELWTFGRKDFRVANVGNCRSYTHFLPSLTLVVLILHN